MLQLSDVWDAHSPIINLAPLRDDPRRPTDGPMRLTPTLTARLGGHNFDHAPPSTAELGEDERGVIDARCDFKS